MKIITKLGYYGYLAASDPLMQTLLTQAAPEVFHPFLSHRWHVEQPQKRYLYFMTYQDLLFPVSSQVPQVLDVGGGITALTKVLVSTCRYSLIDPGVDRKAVAAAGLDGLYLCDADWHSPLVGAYDLVLSNDLFPNVDQRLELFLENYLPLCRKMRLLLTIYDRPRFYRVKRLDAEEQLTVLAWDSRHLYSVLKKHEDRLIPCWGSKLRDMLKIPDEETLFANGRKVIIVNLKGDLA